MDIKNFLKTIKLNESSISMVLGAVVILIVGILVVNYFKKEDTGDTLEITQTESETTDTPQAGKKYSVKEGDTLWSIAEASLESGFEWKKIADANNLGGSEIEKGQELVIPEVESDFVKEEGVIEIEETKTEITGETYTVVKGDNLWNIAISAYGDGYKWVDIARENKLANPNLIHTGNILKLPR